MKIACSSQSFDQALLTSTPLEEFFEFCSGLDAIEGVELEDKHIKFPGDSHYLSNIKKLSGKHKLPIVNLAFDNNFGLAAQADLDAELEKVHAWVKVATALEIPRFRLFAGWPERNKEDQWPSMIETYEKACAVVTAAGMTVVTENHNHGGFLSNSDDVLRLFADAVTCQPKLLLDTGNYVDGLSGVMKTAHLSGHVHAKIKQFLPDGSSGDVDYPAVIEKLKQVGYQDWLSIEYEGDLDPSEVVTKFSAYLRNLI